MSQPSLAHDVIIWGLGGMGSAAAWRLASRGARVLGFDQFTPAHDRGSSHGQTRIIRKAYFEHPAYVPLLDRSYSLWRELESRTQSQLFHQVGLFIAGHPECQAVRGTLQAARDHDLPLAQFTPGEARSRFPGFEFNDDFQIVWEQQAGYLEVERCVSAQLQSAQASGAQLQFQNRLLHWEADDLGVTVHSQAGIHRAAFLVLAAGPWSARDVPGLTVRRKPLFWFPGGPEFSVSRGAGTFFFDLPEGQFYGFPSVDGRTVKVAEHTGGDFVPDPSQVDRSLHPADLGRVASFLARHLPGVDPEPSDHSVCLYTMTSDQHFIIDRHPLHPRVVVAAGFSGHGFKFTPVVGEALADLVLLGQTSLPIGFLAWNRPREV